MGRTQPTHLLSGLQGGYMPSMNEHYPSLGEARQALADWKAQCRDDGCEITGTGKDWFTFDAEVAELVPCESPEECE